LALAQAQGPIRGFPKENWESQRALEQRARAVPQPARIHEYVRRMSQEPHPAGSAQSRAVAEYVQGLFSGWGYQARIETFEALLPYPMERSLEMVAPVPFRARLAEPAIPEDPDSSDAGQLPPYNAYSGSGTVTAPVVYVNYGVPEDYEVLARAGIDVRGKIVLARYGRSWRGTKPKGAAERGAVGCVIYSDPRDDGYFQGDVYPKGAYRPAAGVQRGSVVDMPVYLGDPLTPGWASEPGARRLSPAEAPTLMKIPVLPISYEDALPLLANLGGAVAPESWRGGLPVTYHFGPGPATVRLHVELDQGIRPVHNVLATLPGSRFPDQWVMYGNHHDAWVNGASDPASGAAAVLETARALGELVRQGWRPQRTIVFALWDAEEFGLVGSTEWLERHQAELAAKAVVYLNSDTNGKGYLSAAGSPMLDRFLQGILEDVEDPQSGRRLSQVTRQGRGASAGSAPRLPLSPPGSGSDYAPFIHRAGIPVLNLGFSDQESGGVYHSIYDSWSWYSRFGDPTGQYGKALAQVMATAILRLSEAPVVPIEYGAFVSAVRGYAAEVEKVAQARGGRIDLSPVRARLAELEALARRYEREMEKALPRAAGADGAKLARVNELLYGSERQLLTPEGLPGRTWYRHRIYAPGSYTGYSAKTLPAIREAIEAGRDAEAQAEVAPVARVLDALAARIRAAIQALKQL
jgi:N-acetylated-alpha-linked acidic dipeptidase